MSSLINPAILCIAIASLAVSCKHEIPEAPLPTTGGTIEDPIEDPCDPGTVYFQQQILPLIVSSCAIPGCHATGANDDPNFSLNSYADLLNNPEENGLIVPGNANDGDLMDVILDGEMPPDGYADLSSDQIQLLQAWINQGAQNNSCESACDTSAVTFSGTIYPIIQNSCQGCHSGSTPQGNLTISNYSQIAALANNGFLQGVIEAQSGFVPMPYNNNPLSQCKQDQIRIWIEAGAPNN